MPQLQVLNRLPDQSTEIMQKAGEDIAGTLQKQQALKLTGQYYKIQAQNAQNETDKVHLERLSTLTDKFLPQIANAAGNPAMQSAIIKGIVHSDLYGGNMNQFLTDLSTASSHIQDNHDSVTGQPSQYSAPSTPAMQPDTAEASRREQLAQEQQKTQLGQQSLEFSKALNQQKIAALTGQQSQETPQDGSQPPAAPTAGFDKDWNYVNYAGAQQAAQADETGKLLAAGNAPSQMGNVGQGAVADLSNTADKLETSGGFFGGKGLIGAVQNKATGGLKNPNIAAFNDSVGASASQIYPALTGKPYRASYRADIQRLIGDPTKVSKSVIKENLSRLSRMIALKQGIPGSIELPKLESLANKAESYAKTPAGQVENKQGNSQFTPDEVQAEMRRRGYIQ